MKNLITTITLLLLTAITSFAQKTHYTQYNVIAQAKDVSIIVKDNDYRMLVGQLKKPETVFFLGYSKEQAAQRFNHLLEQADNKSCSNKYRQVRFCGVILQMTITDSETDGVMYGFFQEENRVKYALKQSDIECFINRL